ncbi:MAG: amidohydrolase [Chloroflexota bacterium]
MNTTTIINAKVYTVAPANPQAEAVLIVGNQIAFVGSNEDALAQRTPQTRVIDAGGCTLMPGIHDAHYHLLMGSERLEHLNLEAVTSLDQLAAMIRQSDGGNEWIQGNGLAYDVVGANIPLTRHHLDAIEPNRPIHLIGIDFHTSWANTKALEIAGILHGGEARRPGSEILRDVDGIATGQINEDFTLMDRYIPQPSQAALRTLVKRAIADMNALGITSVTNMDGSPEQIALYADMAANNEFNLRVQVPYSITPKTQVEDIVAEAVPMRAQYSTGKVAGKVASKVRAGSVKLFIDGVIESGTAYMLEPYTRWPDSCGTPLYEWAHYRDLIVEADKHGFQVKVHAIGDAGVRMTLDAYEAAQRANGVRDSRHRIEHIETLHNDDLPRFAQLGVIASMQPLHVSRPADDYYVNWMHCIGAERYHRAFRMRELREQGVSLAFGSDWPVVSYDPYIGISAALRLTSWGEGMRHQAQTLTEAIDGYTQTAAYAEFQEHVKGQIKVGMLADLVLLDCDLFAKDADEIPAVRPLMTICDGEVVYER